MRHIPAAAATRFDYKLLKSGVRVAYPKRGGIIRSSAAQQAAFKKLNLAKRRTATAARRRRQSPKNKRRLNYKQLAAGLRVAYPAF